MQTQTHTHTTQTLATKRSKRKMPNRKDVAAGRAWVDEQIDADPRDLSTWVFLGPSGRTDWYQAYDCGVADTILIPLTVASYAGIGADLRRGDVPNPLGDGIACRDSNYARPSGVASAIWAKVRLRCR